MVHWLLSTTRCKTFALIGRCLRRGVVILQRAVEILQRVVDWAVRLQVQRPAIDMRLAVIKKTVQIKSTFLKEYYTILNRYLQDELTKKVVELFRAVN